MGCGSSFAFTSSRLHEQLEALEFTRPSIAGPVVVAVLGLVPLVAGIALASIGTVFGVTVGMILVASGAAIALVGILVAVTSGVRLAEIERREDELHQLLLMQF